MQLCDVSPWESRTLVGFNSQFPPIRVARFSAKPVVMAASLGTIVAASRQKVPSTRQLKLPTSSSASSTSKRCRLRRTRFLWHAVWFENLSLFVNDCILMSIIPFALWRFAGTLKATMRTTSVSKKAGTTSGHAELMTTNHPTCSG